MFQKDLKKPQWEKKIIPCFNFVIWFSLWCLGRSIRNFKRARKYITTNLHIFGNIYLDHIYSCFKNDSWRDKNKIYYKYFFFFAYCYSANCWGIFVLTNFERIIWHLGKLFRTIFKCNNGTSEKSVSFFSVWMKYQPKTNIRVNSTEKKTSLVFISFLKITVTRPKYLFKFQNTVYFGIRFHSDSCIKKCTGITTFQNLIINIFEITVSV